MNVTARDSEPHAKPDAAAPTLLVFATNKIKRLWYGAFTSQRWTIGFASGTDVTDISWVKRGQLLPPLPGGDFLADPFVVPGTAGRVILCEWMQARRGKGVIARVEINDAREIVDMTTLIDWSPYHLSYPHVFTYEGALYCCPEACYSRSVKLFKLSPDARQVLDTQIAFSGFASVDPTLFEFEGRWWLFCSNADEGQSNTKLYAFFGPTPHGPWTPHRANPIVSDIGAARPAGRVFTHAGKLYRPAQDCSVRYGGGLRLFEIECLTPDQYRQVPCWTLNPPIGEHGQHGVHTVTSADNCIVYDAYTERFSLLAGIYRLRERYR